jgi:hypothetical protein
MFSRREQEILLILGRKKMSVGEIAEIYFAGGRMPMQAKQLISNAVLNINKKCEFYKLPWRLASKGGGRGGKTIWKQRR